MSTAKDVQSVSASYAQSSFGPAGGHGSARVASIDIFRGLTIVVMIFVNDLSGVKGLPWWTYHMPGDVNGMTYVDMVFPAFLFIVGMSIPLAVGRRLDKGSSVPRLWAHVAARTVSLVVLGLALANSDKVNPQLTGISRDLWTGLVLTGAILFWNVYPQSDRYRALFKALKLGGLVVMAAMFAIFRRTAADGHAAWLDASYWEILGLIGWTYLAVCILYIPTRRWPRAQIAWFAALVLLNIFSAAHWITFTERLPFSVWPFNTGAFGSMTMAGLVTSIIVLSDAFSSARPRKIMYGLIFAAVLIAAGWLLTPLGISKIRATPTWCLYSAGCSVLIFIALYWICDIGSRTSWAAFVKPAGSNTLLTYLLPDLFYCVFGGLALLHHWGHGTAGVVKSLVFTGVMLGLSAILTRYKVRLQI